ncbi:MAG TPA: DUF72 domain-containing protein [Vicinamibacterales bacterium]|nr:DUF72 domain-containing protein [Vicinamibacterales bacterium]
MRVGCSGWHYKGWAGRVYAAALPTARWLAAYAERFDTVELNNSFYRLPEAHQFERWREQVPKGFVFAVKASRFLTHLKRLIDPEEPLERLLSRAAHLGSALGPILYQLPPDWVPPLDRFDTFLRALPRRVNGRHLTHVIEFRDPRCYASEFLTRLERHGVTLCVHDMAGIESPRVLIGPSVYVRLHGYGSKYGGSYPARVLGEWASWLTEARATGRHGYVYFNNDRDAHAVDNAETLIDLLAKG